MECGGWGPCGVRREGDNSNNSVTPAKGKASGRTRSIHEMFTPTSSDVPTAPKVAGVKPNHFHTDVSSTPPPLPEVSSPPVSDSPSAESLGMTATPSPVSIPALLDSGGRPQSHSDMDDCIGTADGVLLDMILKDVLRTHPSLQFFIDPTYTRKRYMVLARVLFVWSKLNPAVSYVQGMNEIVGVLFYVLGSAEATHLLDSAAPPEEEEEEEEEEALPNHRRDGDDKSGGVTAAAAFAAFAAAAGGGRPVAHPDATPEDPRYFSEHEADVEADLYHIFSTIMCQLVDLFTPSLDDSLTGLTGRLEELGALILLHDPQLHDHLSSHQVETTYYGMRWLTTLLSREFTLPDTIRLWDSMLASADLPNFLRYICATMVMLVREQLLATNDFATIINLLQSYPPHIDVDTVLVCSRGLYAYETVIRHIMKSRAIGLDAAMHEVPIPQGGLHGSGKRDHKHEHHSGENDYSHLSPSGVPLHQQHVFIAFGVVSGAHRTGRWRKGSSLDSNAVENFLFSSSSSADGGGGDHNHTVAEAAEAMKEVGHNIASGIAHGTQNIAYSTVEASKGAGKVAANLGRNLMSWGKAAANATNKAAAEVMHKLEREREAARDDAQERSREAERAQEEEERAKELVALLKTDEVRATKAAAAAKVELLGKKVGEWGRGLAETGERLSSDIVLRLSKEFDEGMSVLSGSGSAGGLHDDDDDDSDEGGEEEEDDDEEEKEKEDGAAKVKVNHAPRRSQSDLDII